MRFTITILFFLFVPRVLFAQFIDQFENPSLSKDQSALTGWAYYSGDGVAAMDFTQKNGTAVVRVDARKDQLGIWWALIKRRISDQIDIRELSQPGHELRIEAKVKTSAAPRRINLHANTNRTTDFHSTLMEYDLADTSKWYTISMTTRDFDVQAGDTVYAQLALMDWGFDVYELEIDYYKAEVVEISEAAPDLGSPIPYHPPVKEISNFSHHLPATENGMLDSQYRNRNFRNWSTQVPSRQVDILTVSGTQSVILRWDFSTIRNKKANGSGILELTAHNLQRTPDYPEDFGIVRVVEILDGKGDWAESEVTFESFLNGKPESEVINGQMIIDWPVNPVPGKSTRFTINEAVMNRLLSGETKGLILKPLGAISASFYDKIVDDKAAPKLHFNLKD